MGGVIKETYFAYWGKADSSYKTKACHLLPYHCLDVAATGELLMGVNQKITQDIANFLSIDTQAVSDLFVFALALHDLGKFSAAFQALSDCLDGQKKSAESPWQYNGKDYRHDRLAWYFWQGIETVLLTKLLQRQQDQPCDSRRLARGLRVVMNAVFGHHGKPVEPSQIAEMAYFTAPENMLAVTHFVDDLLALLNPSLPLTMLASKEAMPGLKRISWLLAGYAVLADWLGSDKKVFHYQSEIMPLSDYWPVARLGAIEVLKHAGIGTVATIEPFTGFKEQFGFHPTPLQTWAEQVDIKASPQLFILEDVTGAGKTEAALTLVHRLLSAGQVDGFYFGLPTMATSNAMFSRIANHYAKLFNTDDGSLPDIVLAHGSSRMSDLFQQIIASTNGQDHYAAGEETVSAQCMHWLSDSSKKALLAQVGVGTIDQALIAVLPRRHQSLRLIGLYRKVLVFDEVHAADEYMFELLDDLLTLHIQQGGSVILLTATLPIKQRQRLADIWLKASGSAPVPLEKDNFPMATQVSLDALCPINEVPLARLPECRRQVVVRHIHSDDDCITIIKQAVAANQSVVWVRNTVNDALEAFDKVRVAVGDNANCLLFHSRYILHDRQRIETEVERRFGKQSTAALRAGTVLIATQVFQESLDVDADLLLSDICPIDDLIQRMGRLHRHCRKVDGTPLLAGQDERSPPVLYVHAPVWSDKPTADWLDEAFKQTGYVYRSPGRLWLGLRELRRLGSVVMPDHARQLVEAVYSESAVADIPEVFMFKDNERQGEARAKAAAAKFIALQLEHGYCAQSSTSWTEDTVGISTRYSDQETVALVLVRKTDCGRYRPWVDHELHAVALSTVTVGKSRYADQLLEADPELTAELIRDYPAARYLQVWLAEADDRFGYHEKQGFHCKP